MRLPLAHSVGHLAKLKMTYVGKHGASPSNPNDGAWFGVLVGASKSLKCVTNVTVLPRRQCHCSRRQSSFILAKHGRRCRTKHETNPTSPLGADGLARVLSHPPVFPCLGGVYLPPSPPPCV
eukprot:2216046-Pyramimonas_sp.AAC.1